MFVKFKKFELNNDSVSISTRLKILLLYFNSFCLLTHYKSILIASISFIKTFESMLFSYKIKLVIIDLLILFDEIKL